MIKSILLENFKAFEKVNVELNPITVIIAPNNYGKSSILQSIKLLKQTIESNTNNVLYFNGDYNYGDYETILSKNATHKYIRYQVKFEEKNNYFDVTISNNKNELNITNNSNDLNITEFVGSHKDFGYKVSDIKLESINRGIKSYSYKFSSLNDNGIDSYILKKYFENVGGIYQDNFLIGLSFKEPNNHEVFEEMLSDMVTKEFQSNYENFVDSVNFNHPISFYNPYIPNKSDVELLISQVFAKPILDNISVLAQFQISSKQMNDNIKLKFRKIRYNWPFKRRSKTNL